MRLSRQFPFLQFWRRGAADYQIPERTRVKCVEGRWLAQVWLPTNPDKVEPDPPAWHCIDSMPRHQPEIVTADTVDEFCLYTEAFARQTLRAYIEWHSRRKRKTIAEELLK